MKLHDLAIMKINEATANQYTTLVLMVVSHQKLGEELWNTSVRTIFENL
jgi:hypothetical protein